MGGARGSYFRTVLWEAVMKPDPQPGGGDAKRKPQKQRPGLCTEQEVKLGGEGG